MAATARTSTSWGRIRVWRCNVSMWAALNGITFGVFCILWGAQQSCRPFLVSKERVFRMMIVGAVLSFLIAICLREYATALRAGPPAAYLVPPFSSWSHYLVSVWWRVFAPYALSLALGSIFYTLLTHINFLGSRLYDSEALFIATSIFLMRHPYWLVYFIALISLALVAAIIGTYRRGKEYRFSLYRLWLPAGMLATILIPLLHNIPWLNQIGFPNLY